MKDVEELLRRLEGCRRHLVGVYSGNLEVAIEMERINSANDMLDDCIGIVEWWASEISKPCQTDE